MCTIGGATTNLLISLPLDPESWSVDWRRKGAIPRPDRLGSQPEVMGAEIEASVAAFRAALGWLSGLHHLLLVLAMLSGLWPGIAAAQVVLNEQFLRELQDNALAFSETSLGDYTAAPIIDNPHMEYELAVRSKRMPLEIRYAVRQFDQLPTEGSVPVEAMAQPTFEAVLLNVARDSDKGSGILSATKYRADDVRKEFNADWGASALLVPKKEFSSDFDRCMVVFISKKRASAFIFYLFNNKNMDAALKELGGVFHVLRFR
jgi:hypothetical protein